MNKQIEALKMAVEGLEIAFDLAFKEDVASPIDEYHFESALITCKEALAEAEKQEPVAWKGLTDVERQDIIKELSGYDSDANNNDVALWIEKALKEKNT